MICNAQPTGTAYKSGRNLTKGKEEKEEEEKEEEEEARKCKSGK